MTTHVVNFWLLKLFHVHVSGYPISVWNQPPRTTQPPVPCTEVRWQYQCLLAGKVWNCSGYALESTVLQAQQRQMSTHLKFWTPLRGTTSFVFVHSQASTHTHSCKTRLPQCWPDATRVWAGTASPRRQSTRFITGKCSPALGMKAELSSNLLSSSSVLTAVFQVSHLDQSALLVSSLTPSLYGYYYSIIIIFD